MKVLKYRDTVLIPTLQPLVAQTGLTFQDDKRPSSSGQDCYGLRPAAGTTDATLASKIAGPLTHRAASYGLS